MTLPLVHMDILFFAVLVATLLATGVFIGWKIARPNIREADPHSISVGVNCRFLCRFGIEVIASKQAIE